MDAFRFDALTNTIALATRTSLGVQAQNGLARSATISDDGRYVSFLTNGSDLSPQDTNGSTDCYVTDMTTGLSRLVSHTPSGLAAKGNAPRISGNGRYVVFDSKSADLVPGDTDKNQDVFLWDATTDKVTLLAALSPALPGARVTNSADISKSGRYVSFSSEVANPNGSYPDVYVLDRTTNVVTLVSATLTGGLPSEGSFLSRISGNGAHLAFTTRADTLSADDTNSAIDVVVWSR